MDHNLPFFEELGVFFNMADYDNSKRVVPLLVLVPTLVYSTPLCKAFQWNSRRALRKVKNKAIRKESLSRVRKIKNQGLTAPHQVGRTIIRLRGKMRKARSGKYDVGVVFA